jgi:fructokinase
MMSSGNAYTLVGLGEILWDMLPDGKKLGGAPANFAYHAQALGARGVVVSCIGDDDLGEEIMSRLEKLGLDRSYIAVDKDHPTGTVSVELDEKGVPNFTIHQNVAWDFIPSNPDLLDLAAQTDAVCFGSLCQRSQGSRDTVRSFLQATKPDCVRVFDINIRQSFYSKDIVHDMLEISNVLKLNDDELPLLAELLSITGSEADILSQLTDSYKLRLIALTRGANGSTLYVEGKSLEHKGFPPAQIADTVGAGDAFTAAMTLGLLQGKELDIINDVANCVASFVCSQSGATPELPDSLVQLI